MAFGQYILRKFTFYFAIFSMLALQAQTMQSWLTAPNNNTYFAKQANKTFTIGSGTNSQKIYVSEGTKYQTIEGFGWTLTQSSAKHINTLNATDKAALLNELFSTTNGIGCCVIRVAMGSSDLSESLYTYDEINSGTDENMEHFSLNGPDLTDVIPILKSAIAINPNLRIIATPWTAPTWMKENASLFFSAFKKGNLKTNYNAAYARYFIKYFEAMRTLGIEIWAITPQNEPLNDDNLPSMTMSKEQEYNFIHNYLGPAIAGSAYNHVKIIGYDHNCNNTEYPIYVSGSQYVDGTAFHLYSGNISALTTVHNATGKNVYFTEQYTSATGNWSGDFGWHMQNVMLGAVNNWARISLEWNLANNSNYTPYQIGGCNDCLGAVTINNATVSSKNVSYYIIAHMSKVAKNGAHRIQSYGTNNLQYSAFLNTNGSKSLVVYNGNDNQTTFDIVDNDTHCAINLPAKAAISLIWSNTEEPDGKVVLQVVDKSKGEKTNKADDNNETNVFCWIDDNLKAQNPRSTDDWWYPMYHNSGITPDGQLIKNDTAWIWQTSLNAATGNYMWNPYMKTLGWKPINKNVYTYSDKDNLQFSVAANGTISGDTQITIPGNNTAIINEKWTENIKYTVLKDEIIVKGTMHAITLYDITGKLVCKSKPYDNESILDISKLSQGFYLLQIGQITHKIQKTN